jgi:uncharacterized protein YecT (DUF1311 family)
MGFRISYRLSSESIPTVFRLSTLRWAYKNMRLLLSILLLTSTYYALAADIECSDRPECWPEGSAMHTALQRRQSENTLSEQLEHKHKELVALISTKEIVNDKEYLEDERLVRAVQAQHKAWQQFKDSECELVGALSGGASTWQSARAIECEENLTSQRLKRTRHAIRCVKRIAPENRRFDQQTCLYQLAPLAVPLER